MHVHASRIGFGLLLSFLAAPPTGCSHSIDFSLPQGSALKLSVYNHGAPVAQCVIPPGSTRFITLAKWIRDHGDGWEPSLVTYSYGTEVSGSGFTLNFLGSAVVLNYADVQFTHAASPADYAFLKCGKGV